MRASGEAQTLEGSFRAKKQKSLEFYTTGMSKLAHLGTSGPVA